MVRVIGAPTCIMYHHHGTFKGSAIVHRASCLSNIDW
jgi:hypothetical protein